MNSFHISTNQADLDVPMIHRFLREESTWAKGIPVDVFQRAVSHSLCFGGFVGGEQVAFARVILDYATFANLVDVFVLPTHRGRGYSKLLMNAVVTHPDLQGLRRFTLATNNAHGLYAAFGFTAPQKPHTLMERYDPLVYERSVRA